jgi:L-alanine-DL-glutamate epimerase-like enolase superfamily enzyme
MNDLAGEVRVSKIEERLAKLESQSFWRFFFQYLFAPFLVLMVGTLVNMRIEANKAAIQRLTAAREMIPALFEGNPEKAFATQRLLSRTVDDELANELNALVSKFYEAKLASTLNAGDSAGAAVILAAADAIGGAAAETVRSSVGEKTRDNVQLFATKSQSASYFERAGFDALLDGDVARAAEAFEKAEAAYPGFHNAYELARLMRRQGTESSGESLAALLRTVNTEYLYGAPADVVARVRAATSGAAPVGRMSAPGVPEMRD